MASDKPRILLVDDERFARQLYSDYLVAAGCDVVTAESGAVARKLFEPGQFQVVVTDLLLPDGDGLDVLHDVKRLDPEVDVIVITAFEKVEPAVRALRGGASDYLVKPVTPDTLQMSVQRCLSLRRVLQENVQLRTSLKLLEASQLVATASDRSKVGEALLPALLDAAKASAGLVVGGREAPYQIVRAVGVPTESLERVVVALAAGPLTLADPESATVAGPIPDLDGVAAVDGLCATIVPLRQGLRRMGSAVIWSEHVPSPSDLRSLEFLGQSAGSALASIERVVAAERLAYIDDLTHLFNSRYLHALLDRETSTKDGRFSLLFIDLDQFKAVNDGHGHLLGSQLLVEVARVLRTCTRERDVCVRYGGDEFCVVLSAADLATANTVAERVRAGIAGHRFLAREGRNLRLTASIGVATYPDHALTKTALIQLADQAMYRGKRAGRNQVYAAAHEAA